MNKEGTNEMPVYSGSNCSVKTFQRQYAKWKDLLRIQKLKPTFSYNYWLFSTLFPSFNSSYSWITTSKLRISFPVNYKTLWLVKIEMWFAEFQHKRVWVLSWANNNCDIKCFHCRFDWFNIYRTIKIVLL